MDKKRNAIILFACIVLLYCLNDFINMYVKDFTVWVIATYAVTFFLPVIGVVYLITKGDLSLSDLGVTRINIGTFYCLR